jgi:hypothetical protein
MIDLKDWEKDWRNMGQMEYLKDKKLVFTKYKKHSDRWEHEHCEFCSKKIAEFDDCEHSAYCTTDKKYWICTECFDDFNIIFDWKVIENEEN